MTVRLLEIPPIDSLEAPEGWMYVGMHVVSAACSLALIGSTDEVSSPGSLVIGRHDKPGAARRWVAAVEGDDDAAHVVGYGTLEMLRLSNPTLAYIMVMVHPDHRRRGIGTLLAEWVETTAAENGRTSWMTWADFAEPKPGEAIVRAAQGDGMPADTPGLIFALARGYTLRQVERRSRLDLPVPPGKLTALYDDALAHTTGYRLHQWWGMPPEEWLPKIAALTTAMSTDPPAGQLSFEEDPWDADRLRDTIARILSKGKDTVTAVAEDLATGEVVAETDIEVPEGDRVDAVQGDTIVRRDHRGHRLGMAVKALNLQALQARYPRIQRLYTYNASENAHMLAINIALGYYPVGGSGTLQQGDVQGG